MPFRERVKRALGRNRSDSNSSSLKLTKTKTKAQEPEDDFPRPKYRGPVDPQHKQRLDAFNWDVRSLRRRNSGHSQYSPFGSRMPSRNHSYTSQRGVSYAHGGGTHMGQVEEDQDDSGDVANVGGTRPQTRRHSFDDTPSGPSDSTKTDSLAQEEEAAAGAQERQSGFASDHRPFTEAELTTALTKTASKRPTT